MGTRQPQLQHLAALLKVIQLWAEVEGTLRGEEAEPPTMGHPPSTPLPSTHLPLLGSLPQHLQWPLRLRHSERRHTGLGRMGVLRDMGVLRNMGEHTPKTQEREDQVSLP